MAERLHVVDQDGVRATVVDRIRSSGDDSGMVRLRLANGETFAVPESILIADPEGNLIAPFRFAGLHLTSVGQAAGERIVVPIVSEVLHVERRQRDTGRVRLTKKVRQTSELIDQPIFQERVHVERVRVNRVIDQPVAERYEGDTLIIPVLEETFVVEKRLVLKEELHVTKERVEKRKPQRVTLRHEEVSVDRLEPENTEQDVTKTPA